MCICYARASKSNKDKQSSMPPTTSSDSEDDFDYVPPADGTSSFPRRSSTPLKFVPQTMTRTALTNKMKIM